VNLVYQALTAFERAQPLSLLGCDTTILLKLAVVLVHPYTLLHNHRPLLTSFPTPEKRKRDVKRERLDSFYRHTGPSAKTSKAGFMTVVDYVACRVPADPALPRLGEDTWCPLWHSMGGDSVRHHTSSSAHCYSIMASSCTM
jgi:hypothetical protein